MSESNRISEGSVWEALKEQWNAEGQPPLLENRGNMFQVISPDGEPIFIPAFGESLYSSTSVVAKGPKAPGKPAGSEKPAAQKIIVKPVIEEPEKVELEQEIESVEEAEESVDESEDVIIPEDEL